MSKCLLYADWLETLGGGERYLFALAEALSTKEAVVVGAPGLPSLDRMAGLGFPCSYQMQQISRPSLPMVTEGYDLFVHLTTRLPMPSRAARSFAVVQFPADSAGALSAWRHPRSRLRSGPPRRILNDYEFVTYSEYSRLWVSRRWGVEARVLNPPLVMAKIPSLEYLLTAKEKRILSVGRFFGDGSAKRQDILIEAFKLLPAEIRESFQLVLAGIAATDPSSQAFVESLRRASAGHNIVIALDQSPEEIEKLYCSASLFWHAAGYGRPARHPDLAEHFGMVTVEAMSRAVVPLVYGDGGQIEVVRQGAGSTWQSLVGLVEETTRLLGDTDQLTSLRRKCYEAAGTYRPERFARGARQILLGDATKQAGAQV